ncbi:MAG: HEAT repeat domain-containing protein [Anaerolineae bacterium]|nr:HEAT repeat domain-containing protein [Anaerolineae bacterium]
MSSKQQKTTGQEPGLGGAEAARLSRSRNLPRLGGSVGVMHLVEHLNSSNQQVRERALFELAKLGDGRALDGLLEIMRSERDDRARDRAIRALGLLGDPRAVHPLIEYTMGEVLKAPKQIAAVALGRICEAHPEIVDGVVSHLLDRLSTHHHRVALMLGEIGDIRAVEPLAARLDAARFYYDGTYVIAALGILGKRHADAAPRILDALWRYRCRFGVVRELVDAFLVIGLQHESFAGPVVQALEEMLLDQSQGASGLRLWAHAAAARALGEIGARHTSITPQVVDILIAGLGHTDPLFLESVALALGGIDDDRASGALQEAFKLYRDDLGACLAKAMGRKGLIGPLLDAMASNAGLRSAAAEGLGASGDLRTVEPLIGLLTSEDFITRREAAKALGLLRDPRAVQPLIGVLSDGRKEVRRAAAEALGKIEKAHPGTAEPAVPDLIPLLHDETRSVREATAKTLERIQTDEAHEAVWQWRFPDAHKGA